MFNEKGQRWGSFPPLLVQYVVTLIAIKKALQRELVKRLLEECASYYDIQQAAIAVSSDHSHFLVWLDKSADSPYSLRATHKTIISFQCEVEPALYRYEEALSELNSTRRLRHREQTLDVMWQVADGATPVDNLSATYMDNPLALEALTLAYDDAISALKDFVDRFDT